MDRKPNDWIEPIAEGLWKPDLLFELPRHANWIHGIWVTLAVFDSIRWLYGAAAMHLILAWLTMRDPEWPAVVSDFFSEPNEMEP